ncbi:MAG: hypothetical protein QHJ73_09520 [Armatimonadota bacterium]|nr:hypothetical protein [Armatimonadota bacterium]
MKWFPRSATLAGAGVLGVALLFGASCRVAVGPVGGQERGGASGGGPSQRAEPVPPQAWGVIVGEETPVKAPVCGGTVEWVRLERAKTLYGPGDPGR